MNYSRYKAIPFPAPTMSKASLAKHMGLELAEPPEHWPEPTSVEVIERVVRDRFPRTPFARHRGHLPLEIQPGPLFAWVLFRGLGMSSLAVGRATGVHHATVIRSSKQIDNWYAERHTLGPFSAQLLAWVRRYLENGNTITGGSPAKANREEHQPSERVEVGV